MVTQVGRNTLPELSRSELGVMKVLWRRGASSVREVHDELAEKTEWAYSTTKTIMDRMVKKGTLGRGAFHGIFLYEPRISKAAGLARMVRFFADRVLELDSGPVLALVAESGALTAEEVSELESLLAEAGESES